MSHDTIELNGKRYDAFTGEYLGKASVMPKNAGLQRKTIDGFARLSPRPAAHHTTPKPTEGAQAVHHKARTEHRPTTLKHHHPERTHTLMRQAVQRPTHALKPAIKVQVPAEVMAAPHVKLNPKPALSSVDPRRLNRAAGVAKHQAIRRFQPEHRASYTDYASSHTPLIAVRPAPPHAALHPSPHPAKKLNDIFESAIVHATSHEHPAPTVRKHHPRRRLVNSLSVVATFLVIGGFISYLNLPNLSLRVASVQAGFRASIPGYTPTGYALDGGVKRTGGTVSLSFSSGENHFTITQQASAWNSQTLLDNTLALAGPHQAVQENGQTIYIYGDGTNAAWINGGVRYDLSSNTYLDNQEIADIAINL